MTPPARSTLTTDTRLTRDAPGDYLLTCSACGLRRRLYSIKADALAYQNHHQNQHPQGAAK